MSKRETTKPAATPRGPRAPRRAKRELVRGEPVVQRVLDATMEELARVGYRALRVEDVAARAGVNKTTVYRRWPEKGGLIREALACLGKDTFVLPETGSLRADLLVLGRNVVEMSSSPRGQSIMRMLAAEGSDPEVADVKRSMRKTHGDVPMAIIGGAVKRGELPDDFDHHLLFGTFMGAIHHKIFFMNDKVTGPYLERLVDMLIEGARHWPLAVVCPSVCPPPPHASHPVSHPVAAREAPAEKPARRVAAAAAPAARAAPRRR